MSDFFLSIIQVENDPSEFGLCVVYDNGFKEPCKEDTYPLHQRLKLGPNEDIAKIFVMEASECQDIEVSSEVRDRAVSAVVLFDDAMIVC